MNRFSIILVGAIALAACLLVAYREPSFGVAMSRQSFDIMRRATALPPQSDRIVLVDIDDASLRSFGQWPWPRTLVARLLDRLWGSGAAVVVTDVIFPEPDRTSPQVLSAEWAREYGHAVAIEGIPPDQRDHDRVLAEAIGGGKTVLACYMASQDPSGVERPPDALYRGHSYERGQPALDFLPQSTYVIASLPVLREAAAGEAFFNTLADDDNVIRRTPLIWACGPRRLYAALSLEALRLLSGVPDFGIEWDSEAARGVRAIRMGREAIPTDANGCLFLNFRKGSFPRVSAAEILGGRVDGAVLSNKVLFIGTSAAGLRDLCATPLGSDVPGIEVHATALDNLLAGDMLHRPRWMFHANLAAILLAGVFLIAVNSRTRALTGFLVAFPGMVGLGVLASWILLTRRRIVAEPALLVVSVAFIYTLMTVVKFWREERERWRIRTMFSPMVSPEVLEYLEEHPDSFSLAGEKVESTVFFSDIANFTSVAETLTPDILSAWMNRYLTPMADIIMGRHGYVDKFNGDAIMAVWNVPNRVEDHAVQACLSALEQVERLRALRGELEAGVGQELAVRMGISTGLVTAGKMGSEKRNHYTVLGDAANTAARLQEACKEFGTNILISGATFEAARSRIEARCLGAVEIRGKSRPVDVYELLAPAGGLDPTMSRVVELYESAARLWKDGKPDECADFLRQALALKPDDGPSLALQERIRARR